MPSAWLQARTAKIIGKSRPTVKSFFTARREKRTALTKKAAITSADAGIAGCISKSRDIANRSAGASNSCTFITCGVWLSLIVLLGFLRNEYTAESELILLLEISPQRVGVRLVDDRRRNKLQDPAASRHAVGQFCILSAGYSETGIVTVHLQKLIAPQILLSRYR